MGDYDRRQSGGGGYRGKKRRYQQDDDEDDRRGPRRRQDAPPHVRVRKQLLAIAENAMRPWHEEVQTIANLLTDNWDDELLRGNFVELVLQLTVEQPLKTPFLAAVVLVVNTNKPELVDMLLGNLAGLVEDKVKSGEWRGVKLYLKLLACLQSCLEGDGIFPLLEELFSRAVDLQTASSEDTIGTELVKIILLTLPYVMSSTAQDQWHQKAADLMDKTDIIASEPHTLQVLIDPYHMQGEQESPAASSSLIGLLQKQLQVEASRGWELACLPRPWVMPPSDIELQNKLVECTKHALPSITIPTQVIAGPRPLFPEVYYSVYMDQRVESVPPVTSIAASVVRDALIDTLNILDYNRNVSARHLIDVDCYFAPRTFAARATPFDRLREIEPPKSTWKPEDVAVDAVFSQLFLLPSPEHKLVYYHSVLTEACRQAPAAIAPSLGRAIRYLYSNNPRIDLELANRFADWFAHHLSNFGFTWKWTEWVDDVYLPDLHPQKAFIQGSIDKEIRLSFAQRIRNTLPDPYKPLIGPDKDQETPSFKFNNDQIPFAAEGRELASLVKRKAPDEDVQSVIERIHSMALDAGLDPLVTSTDIFMTAVLHVGNKTLSHVLAAIERTKDRLLDAGAASEAARSQIISAVMAYWAVHPGVAISIVGKLLNYSILSPAAVVQWTLIDRIGASRGEALAQTHMYELVFNTVVKVTSRVHQLVQKSAQLRKEVEAAAAVLAGMDVDEDPRKGDGDEAGKEAAAAAAAAAKMLEEVQATRDAEIKAMRDLFRNVNDTLSSWANGMKDDMMETADGSNAEREQIVTRWGARWLRVFNRRAAIEEAFLSDALKEGVLPRSTNERKVT